MATITASHVAAIALSDSSASDAIAKSSKASAGDFVRAGTGAVAAGRGLCAYKDAGGSSPVLRPPRTRQSMVDLGTSLVSYYANSTNTPSTFLKDLEPLQDPPSLLLLLLLIPTGARAPDRHKEQHHDRDSPREHQPLALRPEPLQSVREAAPV